MWDFLPLHTLSTVVQTIQLIWDPDAYGLTLTPHDGFHCAAQSAALPETLRRKIILKLNYIYPTQKFYFTLFFSFKAGALRCIESDRDEWHYKHFGMTTGYLEKTLKCRDNKVCKNLCY